MAIHKIEVLEYECEKCGYRWVNRVNGIDGSIPLRCAKCKKLYWNRPAGFKTDLPIGFRSLKGVPW